MPLVSPLVSPLPPPAPAPAWTIAWNAPEGCPDANQVRSAVAEMVDTASLHPGASVLAAEATVTATAGHFVVRIHIDARGLSETKTIDADTCTTLADAYAVIVAFAIDPTAGMRARYLDEPGAAAPASVEGAGTISGEPLAGPTRRSSAPSPPPAVSQPDSPPLSRPTPRPVRWFAGPLVATGAGFLPFPAYGVGGRVALEAGLRWELAGTYWPDQAASVSVDATHAVGARLGLAAAQPSVCQPLWSGAVAFCLGAEVGEVRGRGTGVAFPSSGTSLWLAVTSAVAVRMALTAAVDLRFRLDVGVPVFRPAFVLDQVGPPDPVQAYRAAPVYAVVSFQPEVRFSSTDPGGPRHSGQ